MSETSPHLQQLVELARNRAKSSRRILVQNVADLFLTAEGRLSDRERALMSDILGKLVSEMETVVRRQLAEKFAHIPEAPESLVVRLANDEIEVARPILMHSHVLQDRDLVEIVKLRTQEHRLAVAIRQPLTETVTDALVEYGDENVIEELVNNYDAMISHRTMDFLVEESQRIDRFREPLVRRPDLPPDLAHRMFWWVSASLRRHILSEFNVDPGLLDQTIQETTASITRAPTPALSEAESLADSLDAKGRLNERFLVQTLRSGQVALFIACLARLAHIDMLTARRMVFDPDGSPLAIAWRACDFDRSGFATVYLLTRHAHENAKTTNPRQLTDILALFDSTSPERAKTAIRYWMRDNNYLTAIGELEQDA